MGTPGRLKLNQGPRATVLSRSPWAASDETGHERRLAPYLGRFVRARDSDKGEDNMMQSEVRGWFITGTDTGVGKTRIACLLLEALAREGRCAVGMKPGAGA